MSNSKPEGGENILIKEVSADTIILTVSGVEHKINYQLPELKELMKNQNVTNITYENKVYNIEHINEANFGVVISNKVFNSVLTRELILLLKDNKRPDHFSTVCHRGTRVTGKVNVSLLKKPRDS